MPASHKKLKPEAPPKVATVASPSLNPPQDGLLEEDILSDTAEGSVIVIQSFVEQPFTSETVRLSALAYETAPSLT